MKPRDLIEFLNIIDNLKDTTRHVWNSSGRQESVADHSWRVAVMALLVASEFPELDMERVVKMCLIHDFGEAITGDVPSFYKTKQHEENESAAIDELLTKLPQDLKEEFSELFEEMQSLCSEEAKLFKALDRMEAIITHNASPIESWLPIEYTENFTYGDENVKHSEYLTELKEELKEDTRKKIAE